MSWTLHERVDTATGRVAADVLGDGPPVVLTHGTPSWSYLWRRVAPDLAADHAVHVWDLVGYGDSVPAPGARPSVAVHAATLAELVRHHGLTGDRAPVLVGHDIGGGAVLRALLHHGVRARAAVLLDAAVLTPWVTPVAAHMQAHLEAYRTMPNPLFAHLVAGHLATATARPLPAEAERAYLDRYAGDDGQQRYLDQVAGFTDDDTRDVVARLGDLDLPVHLIWGEQDRWLPLDAGRVLRDAIPGAELTVVPGGGHFLTEDAPDEVIAALRSALPSPARAPLTGDRS